ncbi:MAG: CdaR family protein [Dehalococcoidia bacterium]
MTLPIAFRELIRLLSGTLHSLATNIPVALLSLALATTLWVAVTNEENPSLRRQAPFDVPLTDLNTPLAMTVTGLRPARIRVTLIGPRSRVSGVQTGDVTARVDLAGVNTSGPLPAALSYTATVVVSVRQRGVRAEADPGSVEVTLQPIARRGVPVRIGLVDTLPLGYELSEPASAQPGEAIIFGSKENVDAVDVVVASVKLTGLTVSITPTVTLDPQDSAGHSHRVTVEPASATVSLKVHQVLFTRQILVDPQIRGRPATGYASAVTKVEPVTVKVVGPVDVLNQISTAPTQDIDVEGATSDVIRSVGLQLPNGATLADPKNTVVVTIAIQAQRGPGSIAVAPRLTGLQPGLSAATDRTTVVVNLSGPVPALIRLTDKDVSITLDLTGLGPGAYRIEAKAGPLQGVQVDSINPDHVGVVISNAVPPH